MIANLTPSESLTAVLAGAIAATNPTYLSTWSDEGKAEQQAGSLDGVTAVSVVPAPGSVNRTVDSLNIFNGDSASVVVTISKVVNGTSYPLAKITLQPNYTLVMNSNSISVVSDSGEISQSAGDATAVVGSASGTGVTAVETAVGGIWNKTTLTLVDTPVVMADEAGVAGYGGLKIYDMPRGRIAVLSVAAALDAHKTSAGIEDDFDSDFSMGTAVAANDATLTGTEANLIASTAVTQASSGDTSLAAASTGMLAIDGASTPMDVYVNLVVDDADQDITSTPANIELSGTVEIIWAYLGP